MRNRIKYFALIFILFGCARVTENTRLILGTSVNALYEAKEKGRSEIFDYDYKTCYSKVITILKKMHAYIYLHSIEKRRIVAMDFKGFNKTTEVGIFFNEVSPNQTLVEISSLSPSVLEGVSQKLFAALKGEDIKEEEGGSHD